MGNRTLRDLCWDLRHFLVDIHLENLPVKRSLLQALHHSPPAELTGRCAKEFLNESKSDENIVARVKGKKASKEHKKKWLGKPEVEQNNYRLDDKRKCYRCVSYDHLANDKLCPAKKQKCLKCGVIGHFQRVCQKKMGSRSKELELENTNSSDDEDLDMCVLCVDTAEEHTDGHTILCTGEEDKKRKKDKVVK
ncbi:hypothetical protein NDU88_005211 [Pleurodeles waltl]|uniref:CCHC-type domain-containing protein n=1 Tax=Pleurodeles waltl TaxID=8319 RepID=A0AAV7QKI3_PLEWA|nr:hypothetical protein NDU88_005211 [Pleurodeles waltl]